MPGGDRGAVEAAGRLLGEAAAGLRREGRDVEYLRAILMPGDEVVFHVLAASTADTVREASRRAAVEFERVVESVAVDAAEPVASDGADAWEQLTSTGRPLSRARDPRRGGT